MSRQLVRYWRSIFIDNNGSKANANRGLQSPTDDIGRTMGDLHAPYTHVDAMDFLRSVRDEYCPDMVVQMGDETLTRLLTPTKRVIPYPH